MSFITLFTADAAAAHGHEFSCPKSSPILQIRNSKPQMHRLTTITSSVPVAFDSSSPVSLTPPKRLARSKTSYYLAQPAPGSHNSSKPSRALVVQLQKLSNVSRPLPTFDVLPASVFAPRLKRKFAKFFKNGVGMQDLVFLASEDFGDDDDEADGGEESLSSRHVLACVSVEYKKVIGEEGKGTKITVIRLDNGPQWEISQTSAGGYEFVAYEEDGNVLTARWNPKNTNTNTRRRSYQTQNSDGDEEKKFQFSLVNPNSKKHPILGSLSKQTIEINDRYPLPLMSSPLTSPTTTPPQSRPSSPVNSPLGAAFPVPDERVMVKTSEHMRALILVSGIWVALREGLATSSLRLDEPLSPSPMSPTATTTFPECRLVPVIRPTAGRAASDPPKGILEDPIIRRPSRANTLNQHRHSTPEASIQLSVPRRSNSLSFPSQQRPHSYNPRTLSNTSPVPSQGTTRTSTPEPKPATTRMPDSPPTPPTIGCMQRRFMGHKHTNPVSLSNSPIKVREVHVTEDPRKGAGEKRKWRPVRGLVDMLRKVTS